MDVGERGHASEGWLIEGHSHGPVAFVVRDGVANAHVFDILGGCGSLYNTAVLSPLSPRRRQSERGVLGGRVSPLPPFITLG